MLMKNNLSVYRFFSLISKLLKFKKKIQFYNSAQYWNDRYAVGGNSGAGSYGRLAKFKAEILNDFVKKNHISSVVEYGCGDGSQLSLADYDHYVGFDVALSALKICRKKFSHKEEHYEFHEASVIHPKEGSFDLAISLDVIYHLIEDDVFDNYMNRLFTSSKKYVIIYAYNFDKFYKSPHERGREFLNWCHNNLSDWKLIKVIKNRYPYDEKNSNNTSQSDFFIFEKIKSPDNT